ncbi:MAG: SdpI family protein [Firmicutes bacterium]|nr:SdpI family protein [Bacillota bacterium]
MTNWAMSVLILAAFIAGALAYPHLPEKVPYHWNIRGEVDGYATPFWGAFGLPLLALAIYVLTALLPRIDPKRENYPRFRGPYRLIRLGITSFLLLMQALILMASLGLGVNLPLIVQLAVSLLIILLGSTMPKLAFNYFVGIRTPWTLADEEVWAKTHQVAGKLWIGGGIGGLLTALLPPPANFIGFMVFIIGASLASIVYSYLAYREKVRS